MNRAIKHHEACTMALVIAALWRTAKVLRSVRAPNLQTAPPVALSPKKKRARTFEGAEQYHQVAGVANSRRKLQSARRLEPVYLRQASAAGAAVTVVQFGAGTATERQGSGVSGFAQASDAMPAPRLQVLRCL